MYNNNVKYEELGNKTSIRNKKNRISHDLGFEGKRGSEAGSQMKYVLKSNDVQKMRSVTKPVGQSPTNRKFIP